MIISRCVLCILINCCAHLISSSRLASKVEPDLDQMHDQLTCYQCQSDSRDVLPTCDNNFFKLTSPEEKHDMLSQCPNNRRDFCIKTIVGSKEYVRTTRGCSGMFDDNGNQVRIGCISIRTQVDKVICICRGNKCNSSNNHAFNNYLMLLILLVFY